MLDKVEALKEFVLTKFEALELGIKTAREAMDKRLDAMNEFRDTLRDQASKFITRTELTALLEGLCKDIRELRDYKATMEGKASQKSVNLTMAIAIAGLVVAIIGLIIKLSGK